jgi:O-methyltransferase
MRSITWTAREVVRRGRKWAQISRAESVPLRDRLRLAAKIAPITIRLFPDDLPPHDDQDLYVFMDAVLERADVPGVLVEAGAYKGVGTAKLSHVAHMMGRELVVFDSFEGLPDNEETHEQSILGHSIEDWFDGGEYAGSLAEVRASVAEFGRPEVVRYVPGWFEDTMPSFDEPIVGAYLDVDLAESTRTCLKYLWPRVSPGGVVVSQDGDFPLVIDVLRDDDFWRGEVGCERPRMRGLGTSKMVTIFRDA